MLTRSRIYRFLIPRYWEFEVGNSNIFAVAKPCSLRSGHSQIMLPSGMLVRAQRELRVYPAPTNVRFLQKTDSRKCCADPLNLFRCIQLDEGPSAKKADVQRRYLNEESHAHSFEETQAISSSGAGGSSLSRHQRTRAVNVFSRGRFEAKGQRKLLLLEKRSSTPS